MNEAKKKTRRRYGAELKQQILAQCAEPGASVARTLRVRSCLLPLWRCFSQFDGKKATGSDTVLKVKPISQ